MDFGLTTLVQNSLEGLLKNLILPDTNYVIEQRWSGIMGLGESKTPIISYEHSMLNDFIIITKPIA